jgi:hypothetical protein
MRWCSFAFNFSLAVEFRTSTGPHPHEFGTVFSLRNLYIHFPSN